MICRDCFIPAATITRFSERALDDAVAAHAKRLAASNPEAMAEMKRVFWHDTDDWEARMAERAAMSGRMVLSDFTRDALARFRSR